MLHFLLADGLLLSDASVLLVLALAHIGSFFQKLLKLGEMNFSTNVDLYYLANRRVVLHCLTFLLPNPKNTFCYRMKDYSSSIFSWNFLRTFMPSQDAKQRLFSFLPIERCPDLQGTEVNLLLEARKSYTESTILHC